MRVRRLVGTCADAVTDRVGRLARVAELLDPIAHEHIETEVKFEDGRRGVVAADLVIEDAKTFPAQGKVAA